MQQKKWLIFLVAIKNSIQLKDGINLKNLCIIPARSGSKSIPFKNIINFHNKPLIAWTILSSISSGIFDKVFVSTDSNKIKEISKKYGAECNFLRPKKISRDKILCSGIIEWSMKM